MGASGYAAWQSLCVWRMAQGSLISICSFDSCNAHYLFPIVSYPLDSWAMDGKRPEGTAGIPMPLSGSVFSEAGAPDGGSGAYPTGLAHGLLPEAYLLQTCCKCKKGNSPPPQCAFPLPTLISSSVSLCGPPSPQLQAER